MDTGNLAGMVFVDLKKAFDTVDHKILCGKHESMAFCIGNWPGLDPIYQIEFSTAE